MTYKLFIDDERSPIDNQWVIARTMQDVISAVALYGMPQHISFDHDLGEDQPDGYQIAKFLVDLDVLSDNNKFPEDFSFYVHSQNPIGKRNIECYLNKYLEVK